MLVFFRIHTDFTQKYAIINYHKSTKSDPHKVYKKHLNLTVFVKCQSVKLTLMLD